MAIIIAKIPVISTLIYSSSEGLGCPRALLIILTKEPDVVLVLGLSMSYYVDYVYAV